MGNHSRHSKHGGKASSYVAPNHLPGEFEEKSETNVLDLIAFEAGSFYVNPPDNSNCRKEIPKNFTHSRINENPGCW